TTGSNRLASRQRTGAKRRNIMVDTKLTCQYCGEHFETKSDLQDHEMNCLEKGQSLGQKQQQSAKPQPSSGRQQQQTGRQQTTGKQQETANRTRAAGSGEW